MEGNVDYTVKKTLGSKLTPEQVKRLTVLAKQLDKAEAGYEGAYGLKPRGINEDFFTNKLKRQTAYLASDGQDTVGMALSTPSSGDYDNDIDYINMVSVDEKHRGRGIGRSLLLAALRDSVRRNRMAMLRVNANNPAGLHLYESMGFKPFSHAMVYQGNRKAGLTAKVASVLLKAAAAAAPMYSVASGDTLSAIAKRNGTTVPALARLNGITNPNAIRVGQRIKLPAAAPTAPTAPVAPATSARRPASVQPQPVLRRNNWGNVRYYKNVKWHGLAPNGLKDGDMAVFKSPEDGARAALRTLMTLGKRHGYTLNSMIPHYSPSSENNTPQHIQNISRISGIKPDQAINPADSGQLTNLLRGVIGAESGQSFARRFTPRQYAEIVRRSRVSL